MMKPKESYSELVITGNEDTIKISTVVFFVLGLIIPFWIITLPLFWFISYRTFKSGDGTPISKNESIKEKVIPPFSNSSKFDDLEKIKALFDSAALTEAEFESEKVKILNK